MCLFSNKVRRSILKTSVCALSMYQLLSKGKIHSGKYRQEMYSNFDEERYRERNNVESAFSVIKRRFGKDLKARKYQCRVKEIKIKIILHNLTKAVQSVIS